MCRTMISRFFSELSFNAKIQNLKKPRIIIKMKEFQNEHSFAIRTVSHYRFTIYLSEIDFSAKIQIFKKHKNQ